MPQPSPAAATRLSPAAGARGAAIVGVGAHAPAAVITNADLEAMVETSDTWIVERTGIRERRHVSAGETTSQMAVTAARQALQAAGDPAVDMVMVATVTPDTLFPSTACLVQRALDLPGTAAMDINAACSGFVYGLAMADALVRGGRATSILLVAAESLTTLVDYTDRGTCVLFGDGAGAAVVTASDGPGIRATAWGADGRDADLIYYGAVDGLDAGGEARLRMSGKGTFRMAVERMVAVAGSLCEQAGWTAADVDWLVPHQANLRIVEAAAKRAGIPMERVVFNGDRYGNTSAASIPLALAEAAGDGRLRPGQRVLMLAFGAGATWGGVAVEWGAP